MGRATITTVRKGGRLRSAMLNAAALMLLFVLIFPASFDEMAQAIGVDPHPLSFFIGPALYHYSDAVPNIDFMTQYGAGPGDLMAPLLSPSLFETFKNAELLTVLGSFFFAAGYYFLAASLLGSRRWALSLVVVTTIMNSYGPFPYRAPSGWPIRFALSPLVVLALSASFYAKTYKEAMAWRVVAGVLSGLSLFWVTEIGLELIAVGAFCLFLAGKKSVSKVSNPFAFVLSAGLTFALLSLAVHGPRTLSTAYYAGLIEPLLLYGGGFGAWPVNWLAPEEFLFNVLAPLLLGASVIWGIAEEGDEGAAKRVVVLAVALLSLAQLTKYWNMSLAAVWLSNAYFPALVITYWLRSGQLSLEKCERGGRYWNHLAARGPAWGALLVGLLYVVFFRDARMEASYGISAHGMFRPVILAFLPTGTRADRISFEASEVADADVDLITRNVAPTDPVYIYSSKDWAYLLKAKRAPAFPFLPVTMTPLRTQVQPAMAAADVFFVDNGAAIWHQGLEQRNIINEELLMHFEPAGVGKDLTLYRRRTPVSRKQDIRP
jgi:hypothetical protein